MSEISIRAEEIFHVGFWPVTNSVILSALTVIILAFFGIMLWRKMSLVPGKLQSIVELLLEEILKVMDSVLGSRHLSLKYLPIVGTIFLFVLTANWL
ncbi:hypothetical protein C4571_02220, partial [Candidatus Parcubacteria bacterium]